MAIDWDLFSLAEAPLQIIDGDRGGNYPSQSDFLDKGHCLFLNAGNVTANGFNFSNCAFISLEKDSALRKGKLLRGDVVLTTRGTVGNVAYYDATIPYENVRINSGMVILRPKTSILNPRFLYFAIRSRDFQSQLVALLTGSAQPQLPIRDLNRIKIPLPSLECQDDVVRVLSVWDDKIALNQKMSATLESMARTIFKSLFIDFDPVRVKAAGKTTGLAKEISDLLPSKMANSELGEIPAGWRVGTIGDIASQRTERIGERNAEVLSAVSSGKLVLSSEHFTKQVYSKEIGKYLAVEQYDFAYNPSRINIGSIGMLEDSVLGAVSPVYVVLRPKSGYHIFLECLIREPSTKEWVNALASGSVRQSLSCKDFLSIPCVLPPEQLVVKFTGLVRNMLVKIHQLDLQTTTLSEMRDILLPKLISGKSQLT